MHGDERGDETSRTQKEGEKIKEKERGYGIRSSERDEIEGGGGVRNPELIETGRVTGNTRSSELGEKERERVNYRS